MKKNHIQFYIDIVVSWLREECIPVNPKSDEVFNLAHYVMAKKHPPEIPNVIFKKKEAPKNIEVKKTKKAIVTIYKIFPEWLKNGEKALARARLDPLTKTMADELEEKQKALKAVYDAAEGLIKTSKLFQSTVQEPVNPRGYWHAEALLVSNYVLEILNKFKPKKKSHGTGKPTSSAITITCRILNEIYADSNFAFEPEAVVKAIRSEKRKITKRKFV
ncbi:hypothetical protein GOB93_07620 [Acetobacter musti]|uniref:HEPN domain-containing protein n=1 Tax=Acetobacter musti TaxID=864732 RepID=A0ABX0JMP7_9PROT|nr:hypothetical protein [Acetobacter musti]NHN84512.1 hypothetical protein [Acetobacter musti]